MTTQEILDRLESLRNDLGCVRWEDGIPDTVARHLDAAEQSMSDAVDLLTEVQDLATAKA